MSTPGLDVILLEMYSKTTVPPRWVDFFLELVFFVNAGKRKGLCIFVESV